MGPVDGFFALWKEARETYGQGTPQTGEQFDHSATLRELETQLESTDPGDTWTGAAADAYGAVNTEHRRVIGELANLDQRLGAQVTKSAQIVSAGRDNLENLRHQVAAIAARLPAGTAGDAMRYSLVSESTNKLTEIMRRSNSDLNDVGAEIDRIGNEYAELGNQKFANGPKDGTPDNLLDDNEEEDDEEAAEEDHRRSAEQDVQDALGGDQDAAARVQEVLDGITPGQPLTPEQGSYLSQMQAQQNGMLVGELTAAQERLGEYSDIIGNSWQLMSNEDVSFPKTPLEVGALDDPNDLTQGGYDQLPEYVQRAIDSPRGWYAEQMRDISAIVRDGNPELQTGTQLDRHMIDKADRMMDSPTWENDAASRGGDLNDRDDWLDPAVTDIFTSAGRDHIAVGEHILSDKGDDFVHDITRHAWADDGAAAGSLFSWTGDAEGSPAESLAAATAEKYAAHIGTHSNELLHLPGERTLGEVNPELVQSFAHGLGDYIPDIADLSTADRTDDFDGLDRGDKDMKVAKGIFSVLSTDEDASKWFNGKAHAAALAAQLEYAQAAKDGHPNIETLNDKLLDAVQLKALVEVGTVNAAHASDLNEHDQARQVYERQKASYEFGVTAASDIADFVPYGGKVVGTGIELLAPSLQDSFIGPEPGPAPGAPTVSNMGVGEAAQLTLNPLVAAGVPIAGLPDYYYVPVVDAAGDVVGQRIGSVEEIETLNYVKLAPTTWQSELDNAVTYTVGPAANPVDALAQHFEDLVKKPNP